METFIANKVYFYNQNYQGGTTERYINVSSVYGLMVGYTENNFNIKTEVEDWYDNTSNEMVITLEVGGVELKEFEVGKKSDDEPILLECVDAINNANLDKMFKNSSENVKIIYLVAAESSGYEAWSSASGYTKKFVIVGNFTEVEVS